MIRLILLTITLISLTDVSYASFPVIEKEQLVVDDNVQEENFDNIPLHRITGWASVLSFLIIGYGIDLNFWSFNRFGIYCVIIGFLMALFAIISSISLIDSSKKKWVKYLQIILSLFSIFLGILFIPINFFKWVLL
tara:strand:+ start:640 stop:1047 length:408 start_codon:yes stop_codon:yes gene_type:complete